MPETRKGILYLVATPIGNLADISFRAVETLNGVDFIACEDTRHSRPLLERYGIVKPLTALHEHNEDAAADRLLERLGRGESMALISDAGTPLINDPGFPLVRLAAERGFPIVPIPGPCALTAALSASALPTDRFAFEGFPPRTASARRALLEELLDDPRTLIFYESSHRILDFVRDIAQVFPAERRIVIARELTKLHETIARAWVGEACALIENDPNMQRGEFVVLLQGASPKPGKDDLTHEQMRVLKLLLDECSVKTASSLTAKITGARKELAYQAALRLTEKKL
ncbi:MAG: 16S rRNA (cytidine(1402)-2'-O)-methyltransferase [Methylococcaceae bacterium]|nr:16S rRNA (cytidine(1402)-2'-O)-methyltransferase [Methylococcaceae bacterium]